MQYVKYDGNPETLKRLPRGTIVRVLEEDEEVVVVMVIGDGQIISNKCDRNDAEGWQFYIADWSSLDCGYTVLEYALPPQEYLDFLKEI